MICTILHFVYEVLIECSVPLTMVFLSLQISHLQLNTLPILNSPRPQRTIASLTVPGWQQCSASSHDSTNSVSALRHGRLLHFPTLTLFLPVPSSEQPSGRVTKWSDGVELQVSVTGSETNRLVCELPFVIIREKTFE